MQNKIISLNFDDVFIKDENGNIDGVDFISSIYKKQGIKRGDYFVLGYKGEEDSRLRQVCYRYTNYSNMKRILRTHLDGCNNNNKNCYFSCSIFKEANRKKTNASERTRFINCDVDRNNYNDSNIKPYAVWESSEGSYQAIYLIEPSKDWDELNDKVESIKEIIEVDFGPDCFDLSRFLRIPGSYNYKPERIKANEGEAPQVGNLRILGNKVDNVQIKEHERIERVKAPKKIKTTTIEALAKKKGIDEDKLEDIVYKERDDVGDGSRHKKIYSLMGDLIKLGLNIRDICNLLLSLDVDSLPEFYSKIYDEGRGRSKNAQVDFLTDTYNKRYQKYKKELVEVTVKKKSLFSPKKVDMNAEYVEKTFLIDDFLVENAINLISGDAGIGKSTFAAYIAALGGAEVGKKYFGEHKLIRNYKTLVLNFENDQNNNIAKACRGLGTNGGDYIFQQYFEDYLDYESYSEEIMRYIKNEGIDLVIFDPLSNMLEMGIKDGKPINDFMKFLRRLRDELKITILIITHNVKTSKDSLFISTKDPMALVGGSANITRFVEYISVVGRYNDKSDEKEEIEYNNVSIEEHRKDVKPTEMILRKVKARDTRFIFKQYKITITHNKGKLFVDGEILTPTQVLENTNPNEVRRETAVDSTIDRLSSLILEEGGEVTLDKIKDKLGDKAYRRFTKEFKDPLLKEGIIEIINGNKRKGEPSILRVKVAILDSKKEIARVLYKLKYKDIEE